MIYFTYIPKTSIIKRFYNTDVSDYMLLILFRLKMEENDLTLWYTLFIQFIKQHVYFTSL